MTKATKGRTDGPSYTITVPLDRDRTETAEFIIREMDEATFNAASSLWRADKEFDAARLMLHELRIDGDPISTIEGNFVAIQALRLAFTRFIEPMEAEVKKNLPTPKSTTTLKTTE